MSSMIREPEQITNLILGQLTEKFNRSFVYKTSFATDQICRNKEDHLSVIGQASSQRGHISLLSKIVLIALVCCS